MSEQKQRHHQPNNDSQDAKSESPQKQHVEVQDVHHLKEPMEHAQTAQNQPLDEGAHARKVGQSEGPGRPPLMKK